MNTSLPRSGRAWTVAAVLGMTALTTLGGPTSADAVPGRGSLPFAGGSPAPAGAYDFAAGIRTPGAARFFCTGSLVHPEWVLTAAHCVDDRPSVEVVVGETNLNDSVDPAETRSVDRIVINPRWGGDTGDKHDLAMVHLTTASTKTAITFGSTAAIDKAFRRCYQQRWSAAGPAAHALRVMPCRVGTGVALGWGRTPKSGGQTSSTLNQVNPKMYDLAPKTFWRVKAGACPGDSGGPLLVRQADGRLTQIGVASYAQHGGGWFDWLVGDRCSTKGWDFYADAAGTDPQMWMRRVIAPPPPVTNPGPPSCPNPTKPRCNGDELPQ